MPDPLSVKPIKWVVITKDNSEEVFQKLSTDNVDQVLFGLTDDGYQQLSLTVAEMRNLIAQYRAMIIKYQEYYDVPTSTNKEKSSESN